MKFVCKIGVLLIVILLFFVVNGSAQYFVTIDPRVNYTLVNRKYIQKQNDLRFKFENGATYSLGLSVGYKFQDKHKLSFDLSWSEFDYGRRNSSIMKGSSYGFQSSAISGLYILPSLGFNYERELQSQVNNRWLIGGGLGVGYYIDNPGYTNDTANFNSYNWYFYNNLDALVIVDEIKKGNKWVPLLRLSAGYKMALGRRFYFNPTILYQVGCSNFITFRHRMQYKNESRTTIVDNSLRGSNIQLVLKFEYQFKKKEAVRYLIKQCISRFIFIKNNLLLLLK